MATRSRATGPAQNTRPRPRISYRELDELSDEDVTQLASSTARRQMRQPSRRSQREAVAVRPSYDERSSSDTSTDDSDNGMEVEEDVERPRKRLRYSPRLQTSTKSSTRQLQSLSSSTSRTQSQASPAKRNKSQSAVPIATDRPSSPSPSPSSIPPWQILPYHILRQIFELASQPLFTSAAVPSASIYWLLDTSRLCRSFHEAALAALLYSPPLFPLFRARDLLRLLRKSQEALSANYQTKIQRLDVEVKHHLTKKHPVDLPLMIRLSPQLKSLRLFHEHDEIGVTLWSRPSEISKGTKWDYDVAIFDALDENCIQLRSFEWNGRFPSSSKVIENMVTWHKRSAFQKLESLTLLNLATSTHETEQQEGKFENMLMDAITQLPTIKRLSFQNCTVVNERLFQRMPYGLESLTVIDCVSLTSLEMSIYLRDKGISLIDLRLDSNQSLDLGFAHSLAIWCPKLRSLSMDLTYYDASAYHDVEPYFDHLLPTGPPTWPSSLETIDLAQLRSWDLAAADNFFASLANAAPELPNLRYLSLKAILKNSWRDRAEFRKKWKDRFEKIFLRKWEEPAYNRRVIRRPLEGSTPDVKDMPPPGTSQPASPPRESSQPLFPGLSPSKEDSRPSTSSTTLSDAAEGNSHRRSSRIPVVTAQRDESIKQQVALAAAEAEKSELRRQKMIVAKKAAAQKAKEEERAAIAEARARQRSRAQRGKSRYNEAKSGDASDDASEDEEEVEVPFIQGLCNTVQIRIDDQRPSEAQFNEGDFIDEEPSGDEDWNGVDVDFEDEWMKKRGRGRKYAW